MPSQLAPPSGLKSVTPLSIPNGATGVRRPASSSGLRSRTSTRGPSAFKAPRQHFESPVRKLALKQVTCQAVHAIAIWCYEIREYESAFASILIVG